MVTYQDLLEISEDEQARMRFIKSTIGKYKSSEMYRTAVDADLYDRKRNPDIARFTKIIYTVTGKPIADPYGSNYKIGRAFFPLFINQEVQFLLGNGVSWEKSDTSDKLGTKKYQFDDQVQDAAHKALTGACSYGFWNLDHIEVFSALEFAPLHDENNGALRSGIRFWQVDTDKPFRATLYEEDGYTDYIWDNKRNPEGMKLHDKMPYKVSVTANQVDEERIYQGENYPSFPIIPFWGNKAHQSELVGLQQQIAVYDIIKSGFCDSVEEASYIYWSIQNAPGMDEYNLAKFISQVRRVHAAVTEDNGSVATPHQIDAPTQSREALLSILEKDIFKDAMAFDPEQIVSGAITAQIKAAYNLLEMKTNGFEYCVLKFINGILELAGIDDNPTFTRDRILNVSEEIEHVMQASTALDDEYVTRKILELLGDGDKAEEIIQRRIADEVTRQKEIPVDNGEENGGGDMSGEA